MLVVSEQDMGVVLELVDGNPMVLSLEEVDIQVVAAGLLEVLEEAMTLAAVSTEETISLIVDLAVATVVN